MVDVKTSVTAPERDAILRAFEAFEKAGHGNAPRWLHALHKGGIAHFAELGFPTRQHEEWRFTNVSPIAQTSWNLASEAPRVTASDVARVIFPDVPGKKLVFVDGRFVPELSSKTGESPDSLQIQSLRDAVQSGSSVVAGYLARHARYDENAFAALNTAFLDDGAVVIAPARHEENEPVYLLYLATGWARNVMLHPRTLIVAQRESQVRVIEHYATLGGENGLTNAVTEIVVEESASVEHCKIQEEGAGTYHVATIQTHQARSSRCLTHSISIGGALTRNNINSVLGGERCECTLNGLYLGRDSQLVDHHTAIYHDKPNCNSHEYYHGILDGRSHCVFNGKIFVRPEAQKTDAKQTNRNLLLSDDATIDTKPQLEIFADDVKCTHGATIGQLDAESIFYLRARGIGLETARKMLLHAFASEIVNRISIAPIREKLDSRLFDMYER